ncbi:MAG: NADH-quinone oxidoreductase subunit L, partial [Armatimonadota bacterium]|nr:NADH-quinone oxidoreductase subunit L [Armatimonadota bacterium]
FLGVPESLGQAVGLSNSVERFLAPSFARHAGSQPMDLQITLMIVTTVLTLGAIYAAYHAYVKRPGTAAAVAQRFPTLYQLVYNKYYVDEIYDTLFVRPGKVIALALWKWVDVKVIDGAVNGLAAAIAYSGARLRQAQTGYVRNYALAMLAGAVLVIAYLSVR